MNCIGYSGENACRCYHLLKVYLLHSPCSEHMLDKLTLHRLSQKSCMQVLPLVKAFFVLCEPRTSHLPPPVSMRRRSSTSVSMDLSLAPVTSEETPSQGASPDGKPLEAQLPFLRCHLLPLAVYPQCCNAPSLASLLTCLHNEFASFFQWLTRGVVQPSYVQPPNKRRIRENLGGEMKST